jgi:hypothetical protein
LLGNLGLGQLMSFATYMNPVIPGDHPDFTVTRVGRDFYTTGSSFNPTPVIYGLACNAPGGRKVETKAFPGMYVQG